LLSSRSHLEKQWKIPEFNADASRHVLRDNDRPNMMAFVIQQVIAIEVETIKLAKEALALTVVINTYLLTDWSTSKFTKRH
jgi:hypothetical protein